MLALYPPARPIVVGAFMATSLQCSQRNQHTELDPFHHAEDHACTPLDSAAPGSPASQIELAAVTGQ
jgi:hypothetical protein